MKTISGGLLTHIQGQVTTLAYCFRITRLDAEVRAFTTYDRDLVVDGDTFLAATGSFTPTMVRTTGDMSVDNLELDAVIDSDQISEADLIAGRYDFAAIEIFVVNYADLTQGIMMLRKGTLGDVSVQAPSMFRAEMRGLMQQLQQNIGRVYSRRCDADLGDARCAVNLAPFTVTGTVTVANTRMQFTVSTPPAAPLGKLTWTSGQNDGLAMEVAAIAGSVIVLHQPMPFDVEAGDAYSVYRGCDKRLSTCRDVFNNVINFRGYPYIPGPDRALQYPDAT